MAGREGKEQVQSETPLVVQGTLQELRRGFPALFHQTCQQVVGCCGDSSVVIRVLCAGWCSVVRIVMMILLF